MPEASSARQPYFAAAMQILADEGYGGLKLNPLCQRLALTTGAFYHNFRNWEDFTSQLLEHWHTEKTTRLVELARSPADPLDRLQVLLEISVDLPHRAEAAIRVWASLDPRVRRLQDDVDAERHAIVLESLRALVGDDEAALYARTAMFLLIGFEQSDAGSDPAVLRWSLALLRDHAAALAAART